MQGGKRLGWVDVSKGVLILLVVCHHTSFFLRPYELISPFVEFMNLVLAPICMRLFFALSGMLAASMLAAPLWVFLSKRILPLGYLLTLWATARFVYFAAVQTNVAHPVDGTRWTEIPRVWISPTSELWFLWALILYLVAARFLGRFNRPLVLAIAAGVSVLGMGGVFAVGGFGRQAALMMFPFFLLGCWYGADLARLLLRHATIAALLGLAVYVSLFVLRPMLGAGPGLGLVQVLLSLSGMAWFLMLMHRLAGVAPLATVLSRIGRNTLPIYLTHVMAVSAIVAVLAPLLAGVPMMDHLATPIVTTGAVFVAFALRIGTQRLGGGWLLGMPELRRSRAAPGPRAIPARGAAPAGA